MSPTGDADLLVAARGALLDALAALHAHRDAVIVIGAQAIYLHTGAGQVGLAEATKDSDLALDTRTLSTEPLLELAMAAAGFRRNLQSPQPGSWLNSSGIPVDLMVPESLAGPSGRRGARIPPHSKHAARRAAGLEAALIDHAPMVVNALAPGDIRAYAANVAGPAALLVAKLHKLGERQATPGRLVDKDAHDVYRLLYVIPTNRLASTLARLAQEALTGMVTKQALTYLDTLFAAGPGALGSTMAGRAEEGVGDPLVVSASVAFLAKDLLTALEHETC
ncbi:MAG: GSU2403 family nucleotidyltransferase fold protein [Pseudonocardiaceae bacterium]